MGAEPEGGYEKELYQFYKKDEMSLGAVSFRRPHEKEHYEKGRARAIDMMIGLHQQSQLSKHVLYVAIRIMDRFTLTFTPSHGFHGLNLSLIGVASLLLASKHDGLESRIVVGSVSSLCLSSRMTVDQVLDMEKCILLHLNWSVTITSAYVFLVSFIKASDADQLMVNMVYYLSELGMMNLKAMTEFKPSIFAAATFCLAKCTLNRAPAWDETMTEKFGICVSNMRDCFEVLASHHARAFVLVQDDQHYEGTEIFKKWRRRGVVHRLPYKLQERV